MSGISAWLLSIAGVILLGVLCEFILPEGQMNKYTKVIFSFITLFVIIYPLPKLLGREIDFSSLFLGNENSIQEDYLYDVNVSKLNALHDDLLANIEEEGVNKVRISISANVMSESLEIHEIFVDLRDIEFSQDFENKNIASAKEVIEDVVSMTPLLQNVPITYE